MSGAWVGLWSRTTGRLAAVALSACLLAPAGCSRSGQHVRSGVEMYERGSWDGALVRFRDASTEEPRLTGRSRVRYLAYRGLTHWRLGQKEDARVYLERASAALAERDADPAWLPADVREELTRARREVGTGAPPVVSPPNAGALEPPPGAPPPDDARPPPVDPPGSSPASPPAAASPPSDAPPAGSPAPPPTVGSPSAPGAAPGAPIPPSASPPPADAL